MVKAWLQKNMSKLRAEVWGGNYFLKEVAHLAISPFKKGLASRKTSISPNCCPLLELMFSSHEKPPVQVSSRVGQNGGGSWIRNPSYNLKTHWALYNSPFCCLWLSCPDDYLLIGLQFDWALNILPFCCRETDSPKSLTRISIFGWWFHTLFNMECPQMARVPNKTQYIFQSKHFCNILWPWSQIGLNPPKIWCWKSKQTTGLQMCQESQKMAPQIWGHQLPSFKKKGAPSTYGRPIHPTLRPSRLHQRLVSPGRPLILNHFWRCISYLQVNWVGMSGKGFGDYFQGGLLFLLADSPSNTLHRTNISQLWKRCEFVFPTTLIDFNIGQLDIKW